MSEDETNDHTPYKPPDCADSDYLELACMDRYLVDVLTDHDSIRGRAIDIRAEAEADFLIVDSVDNVQIKVRIDRIKKMVVLSKPRRFDELIFGRHRQDVGSRR